MLLVPRQGQHYDSSRHKVPFHSATTRCPPVQETRPPSTDTSSSRPGQSPIESPASPHRRFRPSRLSHRRGHVDSQNRSATRTQSIHLVADDQAEGGRGEAEKERGAYTPDLSVFVPRQKDAGVGSRARVHEARMVHSKLCSRDANVTCCPVLP